jgi:hypothetical protein
MEKRGAAEFLRRLRGFPGMNFRAKRLECVQLAGAIGKAGHPKSGSKLRALQTLRAVRLQLCWSISISSLRFNKASVNCMVTAKAGKRADEGSNQPQLPSNGND